MLRRLFDLRMIIGVLFLVYGVILTITGALDGSAELSKAEGVRINLWTGLALLVIGGIFLAWDLARPDDPGRELLSTYGHILLDPPELVRRKAGEPDRGPGRRQPTARGDQGGGRG